MGELPHWTEESWIKKKNFLHEHALLLRESSRETVLLHLVITTALQVLYRFLYKLVRVNLYRKANTHSHT